MRNGETDRFCKQFVKRYNLKGCAILFDCAPHQKMSLFLIRPCGAPSPRGKVLARQIPIYRYVPQGMRLCIPRWEIRGKQRSRLASFHGARRVRREELTHSSENPSYFFRESRGIMKPRRWAGSSRSCALPLRARDAAGPYRAGLPIPK